MDVRPTPNRDAGSTSLTTVVLTPVFLVVCLAAFQAALWSHARTEARMVARDVAVIVAQRGGDADVVARSAERNLRADAPIGDVVVTVSAGSGRVVVRITGEAPGIIRGTSATIDVTEAVASEGFRW